MYRPAPVLLFLSLLTAGACGQKAGLQVGETIFVKETVSVSEGQKEAVAGDLTGDGHPELLIAGNGRVTILAWDDGKITVQDRTPAGAAPSGPALANLDGDGYVDVAVANHNTDHLTLLRGNGNGGLTPFPNSPLTVDVDPHPHAVRAADLDADGHLDLIVDHRAGEGLLILRGSGDGVFESPGTLIDGGGDLYRGMAVGDLTGDGHLDLVTPNPNAVSVLLSTDLKPLTFTQSSVSTRAGPFGVDLGDVNGDGHLDIIAVLDEGSSLIQLFLGDGRGAFREANESPFHLRPGGKMGSRGDFNGDGIDDAAITGWNAPDVLLLLGGTDSIRTATLPVEGNSWGPAAADLNGDGTDDLVIPDANSDRVALFVSQTE